MKRNYLFVLLVLVTFFIISFLTNILGPILPAANKSFDLSLALAGFLPLSFFIAYGPTSIPAGYLTEKYGPKWTMLAGFSLMAIGCVFFLLNPGFLTYVSSLFIMGIGMAALQVVINPLLRVSGGEENFAFFSVLAQLVFGAASYVSPGVYNRLTAGLENPEKADFLSRALRGFIPSGMAWTSFYGLCLLLALTMIVLMMFLKFPKVSLKEDEKLEGVLVIKKLLRNKVVQLYFFGIFCYVGFEQGVSVWIASFLETYHSLDPAVEGSDTTALFWGMQAIGGILGLLLMKLFDVQKILATFVMLAFMSLILALFGNISVVLWAFPAIGFFTSVMYPSVFSLGLNSLSAHHGTFAGVLCTGIIGGAVFPFLIGGLGDLLGLRLGMLLNVIALAYLLYIAFSAKPLVKNKTIL
ncbi:MAG: MFS transporter [Flavobacteriaceae bacterium]|nr:MFS transporter [Flavobacteriaceae bacterium]